MKQTMNQHLLEEGIGPPAGDGRQIAPLFVEIFQVGYLDPLDILQGQNRFSSEVPENLGNVNCRVFFKIDAEAIDRVTFPGKIHFTVNGAAEFFNQTGRVVEFATRQMSLDQKGEPRHDVEIGFNRFNDAGAPDFNRHFLAAFEAGAMNLGDRGGGNGF